jgi:hypothetical protein
MREVDYKTIIQYAWLDYDSSRSIKEITDISAKVSTNHVYKVVLNDGHFIIAKMSYFGKFEHFVEDHTIINSLSNNLPYPYEDFLSRALVKGDQLFVHRFNNKLIDAWVIFYRPVKIKTMLPKRLDEHQISLLRTQFAKFHKACHQVRFTLPSSSKNMRMDIERLLNHLNTNPKKFSLNEARDITNHAQILFDFLDRDDVDQLPLIPVFVDWNIGNFSVTPGLKLYSRWDYDWFRTTTRMMDFYFMSRVVSDRGDRSVFSYNVGTFNEERFLIFLRAYHKKFPVSAVEIEALKEIYRFFILNYVIKYGKYFFSEKYATQLRKEAFEVYLPTIDDFNPHHLIEKLLL